VPRRKTVVPITLAVLVVVAAGCGGGGAGASGPLSASQFTSKANAICSDLKDKTKNLNNAQDFDAVLNATNDSLKKLKALQPPASLKAKYQAYLDSVDAGISVLTKAVEAVDDNDFAKAARLAPQAAQLSRKSAAAARAAGLNVCAQS
jgi:predicted dinucleotide-utilizing enzyme